MRDLIAGVRIRLSGVVLSCAALLAMTTPAIAQQPTQAQANAIRQSCRSDYESHCASVPTGGSAALACLQQNTSSLSQPCQRALAALNSGAAAPTPPASAAPARPPASPSRLSPREEMAVLRVDCGADYRRLCSGVRPGGGRAIGCLQGHSQELSPRCQSALLAAKENR